MFVSCDGDMLLWGGNERGFFFFTNLGGLGWWMGENLFFLMGYVRC